jgi:16S rRNA (adenine1518-N6/adenine1519-N6)-dimethyltransferase
MILNSVKPDKKLGQHFLIAPDICQKICNSTKIKDSDILEIGPGKGILTKTILANSPKSLLTIEKDDRFRSIMLKIQDPALRIDFSDALNFRINETLQRPVKIIANLPYNISSQLILLWIKNDLNFIEEITIMIQKELADKIVATCGSKQYGRMSVMCQYFCDIRKLFDVKPGCFYPTPKVTSTVIQLKPKKKSDINFFNALSSVTAKAFAMRRKKIKSSINPTILSKFSISDSLRPQELSVEEYSNIANLNL